MIILPRTYATVPKKRAFEYFGLNEDKSNSQSVSNNVLSLGATAISNMIKQL